MFIFLLGPVLGVILALSKPRIDAAYRALRTLIPFFSHES